MSFKAWHEVMTLTLSPNNGDMYSVHLLTGETILANLKEIKCNSLSGKDNANMKSNAQIIDF